MVSDHHQVAMQCECEGNLFVQLMYGAASLTKLVKQILDLVRQVLKHIYYFQMFEHCLKKPCSPS